MGDVIALTDDVLVAFQFEGMALKESCWIAGKPYFTARTIGEWLEYSDPVNAVRHIVARNQHIRTFSSVVNLSTDQGGRTIVREVEIYDPIGLQLIMNKSNQPRAIAFQVAVAHLVYAYLNGELVPSKWSARGDLISAVRQILSLPDGRKRGALVRDFAAREGVSLMTAYRRISVVSGENLKTTKGKVRRTRSNAGSHKNPAEAERIFALRKNNPTMTGKEIWKASWTSYSYAHVNAILRKYAEADRRAAIFINQTLIDFSPRNL
jgi:hypothetical protein